MMIPVLMIILARMILMIRLVIMITMIIPELAGADDNNDNDNTIILVLQVPMLIMMILVLIPKNADRQELRWRALVWLCGSVCEIRQSPTFILTRCDYL